MAPSLLPVLPNPQSRDMPPGPTPWSNWVIPGQCSRLGERQQQLCWPAIVSQAAKIETAAEAVAAPCTQDSCWLQQSARACCLSVGWISLKSHQQHGTPPRQHVHTHSSSSSRKQRHALAGELPGQPPCAAAAHELVTSCSRHLQHMQLTGGRGHPTPEDNLHAAGAAAAGPPEFLSTVLLPLLSASHL